MRSSWRVSVGCLDSVAAARSPMLICNPVARQARTRHSATVKPRARTSAWNSEEISALAWPSMAGR
ncbi:hypothetical protein D3C71_1855230 [compost metagenome]